MRAACYGTTALCAGLTAVRSLSGSVLVQALAMRLICVNLARLRQNFTDADVGEEGYFNEHSPVTGAAISLSVSRTDPILSLEEMKA